MAQETYGEDQHQEEQLCQGQSAAPCLLQQTLEGYGVERTGQKGELVFAS